MNGDAAMIRVSSIWKTYHLGDHSFHALQDVTETISKGEHVAIMGPSGSGKSTLLNILGCLDQPSQGTYHLDGVDVSQLDTEELAGIRLHKLGFIFQAFHLIPRLDALSNVELPMIFEGIPREERRQRAMTALEAVGLGGRADHRPAEMSGGEKQRVAIARATMMNPPILLCDEPTGNLDSASGKTVLTLLDEMNQRGITLVVVTHDPNVARKADRVLVLRDGKVARRVDAKEVTNLTDLFAIHEDDE